jgi:hypothetical protein
MTTTLSQTILEPGSPSTRKPPRRQRARTASHLIRMLDQPPLGRYTDHLGRAREVISRPGAGGSVLVLDCDRETLGDRLLVAHLGADEPAENATIVCADYLVSLPANGRRCRALKPEDIRTVPFADEHEMPVTAEHAPSEEPPTDRLARRYTLEPVGGGMSIPALRWCRHTAHSPHELEPVSVREAIASIESYEPVRTQTALALIRHRASTRLSTTVLRSELVRVQESPIVLNRKLREVVLERVVHDQLSLSEIAIRCGRVKRDRKGNESGETSWLARRIGLLPEGGQRTPTPWVHSDVLALIARSGLGTSPREVEL